MSPNEDGPTAVISFSEHIALAGLMEQWEKGDQFAIIEAMDVCGRYGEPYPDWVRQVLDEAARGLFEAAYHQVAHTGSPNDSSPRFKMHDEKEFAYRLERARDHLLSSLGLAMDRDNSAKIRKRFLRDAYLAELVSKQCEFVLKPKAKFKGVNRAQEELAVLLAPGSERPQELKHVPAECFGASDAMIKRAWELHKDKLIAFHLKEPNGPATPLDWLLFGSDRETVPG